MMLTNLKRFIALLAVGALLLTSCSDQNELLYGKWKGVTAERVSGDSMRLDASEIGFQFDQDGTYAYTSTLQYREAGKFEAIGQKLIAIDTTQSDPTKREAIIELLTEDSLNLRWINSDEALVVKLIRVNN
ncbi:MAG: hypothetical protein AAF741_14895 [Bacteroidota bacterium]